MKNVTITVEEDVAAWARVHAAQRGTSVSRLVGQMLKERMEQEAGFAPGAKPAAAPKRLRSGEPDPVYAGRGGMDSAIDRARAEGPQILRRRGEEVAVVLSTKAYRRLLSRKPDFKRFLIDGPPLPEDLLERDPRPPREVEP